MNSSLSGTGRTPTAVHIMTPNPPKELLDAIADGSALSRGLTTTLTNVRARVRQCTLTSSRTVRCCAVG